MFIKIIIAFVIPWIFGIFHLYKQDKKIILFIGTFSSFAAFTINEFGFYFNFWEVAPSFTQGSSHRVGYPCISTEQVAQAK